jgi:hypothetical protein
MQLPVKTIKKHKAAVMSVRLIILVRIILCNLQANKKIVAFSLAMMLEMLVDVLYVAPQAH